MIKTVDKEKWLDIYSDQNKKIKDKTDNILYNGYENLPIHVNKTKYNKGLYEESDIDCDVLEIKEPSTSKNLFNT